MCSCSQTQLLQLVGCDMFGRSVQPQHISQQAEIDETGMFISNHIHSVRITHDHESTSIKDYIQSPKISSLHDACRLVLINIFKGHTVQQHAVI